MNFIRNKSFEINQKIGKRWQAQFVRWSFFPKHWAWTNWHEKTGECNALVSPCAWPWICLGNSCGCNPHHDPDRWDPIHLWHCFGWGVTTLSGVSYYSFPGGLSHPRGHILCWATGLWAQQCLWFQVFLNQFINMYLSRCWYQTCP